MGAEVLMEVIRKGQKVVTAVVAVARTEAATHPQMGLGPKEPMGRTAMATATMMGLGVAIPQRD